MSLFSDFPRYIITRGAILSAVMLASVAVMLAYSWQHPIHTAALLRYADYLQSMGAVVLGAALLGGLALEDVLRR